MNIFGGIAKCDLIADALVKAGREVGFKVPVVVRLEGTERGEGPRDPERRADELPMIQTAAGLTEAAKMVVAAAKVSEEGMPMATAGPPGLMTAEEFYEWANRPENADKWYRTGRGEGG